MPKPGRVLLTEREIRGRVEELGRSISRDHPDSELLLISVLKGSLFFLVDLVRSMSIPVTLDFMAVSSYGSSTESSGVMRIVKDLDENIEGRKVLLVEDIIDTGLTLCYLLDLLSSRSPASVEVCALLDKASRRVCEVPIHYRGFVIPNEFVIGYGLDYDQKYRFLPYIAILEPD